MRQLYSLDAHTIFVVGDSGMAYRTFDYGETWEDVSLVTSENFTRIAAKNFEDYLIISKQTYLFHKNGMGIDLLPIKSNSIVPLYSVAHFDDKYYFGGGAKKDNYYDGQYYLVEYIMPYYTYDRISVKQNLGMYLKAQDDGHQNTYSDSIRFFPTENILYYTCVNKGNAIVIPNISGGDIYNSWERGYKIDGDRTIYVDHLEDEINMFSREGKWFALNSDEHKDFNITPINSVFRTNNNSFIISSNNSTIYKVKMNEVISSVESNTFSNVKLLGNILLLDRGLKLLSVYNYMGVPLEYEKLSDNLYRLPKGLNFVSFSHEGITKTIKISVIE